MDDYEEYNEADRRKIIKPPPTFQDLIEMGDARQNDSSKDPGTLEIMYDASSPDDEEGFGQLQHEVVFVDPGESGKGPRLLVSLNSVMALKSLCEREFDRVEVVTSMLNTCRIAYWKELVWLREQLLEATQPPERLQKLEVVNNYEVYWYNPMEYVDDDLKAFLQEAIRITNKRLIEENYDLRMRCEGLDAVDEDTMMKKLLEKNGPGKMLRRITELVRKSEMASTDMNDELENTILELFGHQFRQRTPEPVIDLQPQVDALRRELDALRESSEQRIRALEAELEEAIQREAAERARAEMERLRAEAERERAEQAELKVTTLSNEMAQRPKEDGGLSQLVESAAKRLSMATFQLHSIHNKGSILANPGTLEEEVPEFEKEVKAVSEHWKTKEKEYKAEIATLQKKIKEAEDKLQKAREETEKMKNIPRGNDEELEKAKAEAAARERALLDQIEALRKQKEELEEQYKGYAMKLTEAEEAAEKLMLKLESSREKISDLKKQIKELKSMLGLPPDEGDADDEDEEGDTPRFLISYNRRVKLMAKPRWMHLSEDAPLAQQKRDFLFALRSRVLHQPGSVADKANKAFEFIRQNLDKNADPRRKARHRSVLNVVDNTAAFRSAATDDSSTGAAPSTAGWRPNTEGSSGFSLPPSRAAGLYGGSMPMTPPTSEQALASAAAAAASAAAAAVSSARVQRPHSVLRPASRGRSTGSSGGSRSQSPPTIGAAYTSLDPNLAIRAQPRRFPRSSDLPTQVMSAHIAAMTAQPGAASAVRREPQQNAFRRQPALPPSWSPPPVPQSASPFAITSFQPRRAPQDSSPVRPAPSVPQQQAALHSVELQLQAPPAPMDGWRSLEGWNRHLQPGAKVSAATVSAAPGLKAAAVPSPSVEEGPRPEAPPRPILSQPPAPATAVDGWRSLDGWRRTQFQPTRTPAQLAGAPVSAATDVEESSPGPKRPAGPPVPIAAPPDQLSRELVWAVQDSTATSLGSRPGAHAQAPQRSQTTSTVNIIGQTSMSTSTASSPQKRDVSRPSPAPRAVQMSEASQQHWRASAKAPSPTHGYASSPVKTPPKAEGKALGSSASAPNAGTMLKELSQSDSFTRRRLGGNAGVFHGAPTRARGGDAAAQTDSFPAQAASAPRVTEASGSSPDRARRVSAGGHSPATGHVTVSLTGFTTRSRSAGVLPLTNVKKGAIELRSPSPPRALYAAGQEPQGTLAADCSSSSVASGGLPPLTAGLHARKLQVTT